MMGFPPVMNQCRDLGMLLHQIETLRPRYPQSLTRGVVARTNPRRLALGLQWMWMWSFFVTLRQVDMSGAFFDSGQEFRELGQTDT